MLAAACLSGTFYKDHETDEWIVDDGWIVLGGKRTHLRYRYKHWRPALVHWSRFHDKDWYHDNYGKYVGTPR